MINSPAATCYPIRRNSHFMLSGAYGTRCSPSPSRSCTASPCPVRDGGRDPRGRCCQHFATRPDRGGPAPLTLDRARLAETRRSGAYVAASIDTMGSDRVLDDAWVLVPALFAPAYIGGRTAAEHWDLTEQIFKDIVVITGQAIRQKRQRRQGSVLAEALEPRRYSARRRSGVIRPSVPVSDVHRTIIDMLDDPAVGGGIQHVADCLDGLSASVLTATTKAHRVRGASRQRRRLQAPRFSRRATAGRCRARPNLPSTTTAAAMRSSIPPWMAAHVSQVAAARSANAGLARKRHDR